MNILIIRVSAIGDVIHALPSLFFIKRTLPQAKISWVVQEKAASLLKDQPILEKLFILPDNFLKPKNWAQTANIIKQLRQTKWDAIIDFQGLLKTSFLLASLRGEKFGFWKKHTRERLSTWFTHHHTKPTYTNIIQKNLALASDVVSWVTPETKACPSLQALQKDFCLHVSEEKKRTVDQWLHEQGINSFITNSFVAIAPNTTWPSKHWPLEHWKKLLELLSEQRIVLLGKNFGQAAQELAHHIKQKNLPVALVPAWDLLTTSYLLQKTNLLIAPDTGLLHLADFLGTKTIGLFGPTLASKHGPFLTTNNITRTIQTNCMTALTPEQLFKTVLHTLTS